MYRVLVGVAIALVAGCASAPPPYIAGKPSDKPCNWSPESKAGVWYLHLIRVSDDTMVSQGPYAARIKLWVTANGETPLVTLYAAPADELIVVPGGTEVNGLAAKSCEAFYTGKT